LILSHIARSYRISNVKGGKEAVAFYRNAFGAEVIVSFEREGELLAHAELRIEDAAFMVREEYPEYSYLSPATVGGTPVNLLVYVADTHSFTERAVKAGATLIRPVEMQFHGDFMSELRDPFGHSWFFATRVETMTAETTLEAAKRAKL
jgi:PhnB protein